MQKATIIIATVYLWMVMLLIIAYLARKRIILRASPKEFLEAYFVGGRAMGWLVIGLSASITTYSMGTFIGWPGLCRIFGYAGPWMSPAQGFLPLLIFLMLGRKLAIVARRIKAVTPMDIIGRRFESKVVEIVGAMLTIIFLACYVLPQFLGGARIFEATTGFPYRYALVIFIVLCAIYTALGGFAGEAWTDTVQGIIGAALFGILIASVAVIVGQFGGLIRVSEALKEISPTLIRPTPTLFNLGVSFIILIGLGIISLPHSAVRAMAYKDIKALRYGIIIGLIWCAIANWICPLLGVLSRIFFPELAVGDLAVPSMIEMAMVNPVLIGLMIAVPLAAGLTTIDSMLLIVSSTFVKNICMCVKPDIKPETTKKLVYLSIAVTSAFVIYAALYPPPFLEWIVLYAIGGLIATYFAPLIYGLYWKRANKYGALASMIGGTAAYIISDYYLKPYLHGFHVVVPAFIVANLLFVGVSLITPKPSREVIKLFWGIRK